MKMNFLVVHCWSFLIFSVTFVSGQSFWDSVIGVSQGKMLFLYIVGEEEQAEQTWDNFTNITYLWENVKTLDNNIPGYGHVKSVIVAVQGDEERAIQILRAANKGTLMIGGFILAGPSGAVGGLILADVTSSLASGKPQGVIDHAINFKNKTMSEHFDIALDLTLPAVGGELAKPMNNFHTSISMTMKKSARNQKKVTINEKFNTVHPISPNLNLRSPSPDVVVHQAVSGEQVPPPKLIKSSQSIEKTLLDSFIKLEEESKKRFWKTI